MAASLPAPNHLLTSLLSNLFTSPLPPPGNPPPQNPLKNLPPAQKSILTTLHVLFPPPMLLQSLDLLDRGLITRMIQEQTIYPPLSLPAIEGVNGGMSQQSLQADIHLLPPASILPQGEKVLDKRRNYFYMVNSSRPPKSRFSTTTISEGQGRGGGAGGGGMYIVRLEAWNCSCAAFAFSAFPSSNPPSFESSRPWNFELNLDPENGDEDMDGLDGGEEADEQERGWKFGGRLDVDGNEEEMKPICKHLLACLLAEKWDLLAGYIKERGMGREEMAGLCGG